MNCSLFHECVGSADRGGGGKHGPEFKHFIILKIVGLGYLRILRCSNNLSAIYRDLEARDTQSLKSKLRDQGSKPRPLAPRYYCAIVIVVLFNLTNACVTLLLYCV